jgi:hypothetical protein
MRNPATSEWSPGENDRLVDRLRGLEWAEVPTGVRERCWEQINVRLVSGEQIADGRLDSKPAQGEPCPQPHIGERYAYTRRRAPMRHTLAQTWSRGPVNRPRSAFSLA